MKLLWVLTTGVFGGLLIGADASVFADHQDTSTVKDQQWQQVATLFPHTPGNRWVYALSGTHYPNGGELTVEVKGTQHVPHLKQDALLVDEHHPGSVPRTSPEVVPVLYYAREGYLVRDTAHIYSDSRRTSLLSTGNLGEAAAPILPLGRTTDGTEWQLAGVESWGRASRLSITYRFSPEKETVSVKVGTHQDCVRVETTTARGDGSGYRHHEWYAPGVGLVKSTMTDLQSGDVLINKELVSFHINAAKGRGS